MGAPGKCMRRRTEDGGRLKNKRRVPDGPDGETSQALCGVSKKQGPFFQVLMIRIIVYWDPFQVVNFWKLPFPQAGASDPR